MLIYPDLILTAPADYRGLRDPNPVTGKKWKWSFNEIREATGRSQSAWCAWNRPHLWNGMVYGMPQYISAYMALLDGAHPGYLFEEGTLDVLPVPAKGRRVLPIPTATDTAIRDLLEEHDVSDDEVREAFGWDLGNNRHSVATLGNDGVRVAMLQLMLDVHPWTNVVRRPSETNPLPVLALVRNQEN